MSFGSIATILEIIHNSSATDGCESTINLTRATKRLHRKQMDPVIGGVYCFYFSAAENNIKCRTCEFTETIRAVGRFYSFFRMRTLNGIAEEEFTGQIKPSPMRQYKTIEFDLRRFINILWSNGRSHSIHVYIRFINTK